MQQILTILMLLVLLGSFLLLAGLVYFSEGIIRSRSESLNRDSAAQAHAIRPISPNKSGHGAMGTYLLLVMVVARGDLSFLRRDPSRTVLTARGHAMTSQSWLQIGLTLLIGFLISIPAGRYWPRW